MSGTAATVFGLDVHVDRPLAFLETARAQPTGRRVEISISIDTEELGGEGEGELISDQRHPDGTVNFQIQRGEDGYLIWGPEYGASVLSGDGGRIRGAPGSGGMEAWQRMLIAQALPFAAVLRGLEVLHASAVATNDGAVALAGRSGAGKTSVALALSRRGASFLADDVLALERVGGELIVHPGTPVAGVDRAEAARLDRRNDGGGIEVISLNSREQIARVPTYGEPIQLRALFFLERSADGPDEPCFEPAADAQMLLAATFNLVLADPGRLAGLLDVCALIARSRVERILAGPEVDATELGAAVERRIGEGP
ncbi:MAG: hypothetical protein WB507_09520 [Solirubrobacterales bacterium]